MVSINEKSKLIKIIQKEQLTEEDKEELRHILSKLPSEELKSLLGKIYELFIKNYMNLNSRNSESEEEIAHYNRWLTDNIRNYIMNLDNRIKFLFEPYESFLRMDSLFGLSERYLVNQRTIKNANKIIAKSVLDNMRDNLVQIVQEWINKDPRLTELLLKAQFDIIGFIDDYEIRFNPSPTPWTPMSKSKSLIEHQQDIEGIVKAKGGEIIKAEWRQVGKEKNINAPFFLIRCNKGHEWWALKSILNPTPSRPYSSWCTHPDCRRKSLIDHQRDIEGIVKAKGGEIIKAEWRIIGKKRKVNAPFFKIRCNKGHEFWVRKNFLIPSLRRPKGSWCTHPDCRGKSLSEHRREIESIVKAKGGKIIDQELIRMNNRNRAHFRIECRKKHRWWVLKNNLIPSVTNLAGTWCPTCQDRISAIGTFGHVPIEYFSLIHFNSKNCKVAHEKTLEEGTRPDLIVEREDNFKDKIEKRQKVVVFPYYIKRIAVDFTMSLTSSTILKKCFKNYQSKTRFLLIVLMREGKYVTPQKVQNLININPDINSEDKKRIKVINFEAYLDFLNLGSRNLDKTEKEKKIESKLRGIVTLCKKSVDSDSAIATLVEKSEKYAKLLGINCIV